METDLNCNVTLTLNLICRFCSASFFFFFNKDFQSHFFVSESLIINVKHIQDTKNVQKHVEITVITFYQQVLHRNRKNHLPLQELNLNLVLPRTWPWFYLEPEHLRTLSVFGTTFLQWMHITLHYLTIDCNVT